MVETKQCECGCGQLVKPGNRFISGHQRRGKYHTEKSKIKNREAHLGITKKENPNLTHFTSEEACRKIGDANRGRYHTEEAKKKIGDTLRGKKKPEGFGEKISKAKKGITKEMNPNLAHSEEHNKRISQSLKGRTKGRTWEEIYGFEKAVLMREGVKKWTKTEDARNKQSSSLKEFYKTNGGLNHREGCRCSVCKAKRGETAGANNPNYGKHPSIESRRRSGEGQKLARTEGRHKDLLPEYRNRRIENVVKGRMKRPTSYEKKVRAIIDEHNFPYKYVGDGTFWITSEGKHLNPDFVNVNSEKVVIEVFEKFFKDKTFGSVQIYKKERIRLFGNFGWKIIFISGEDLKEKNWKEHVLQLINSKGE